MISSFAETGVCPFNPEVVLSRLPEVYPPPKQEKGRTAFLADVASYMKAAPTYAQTQYVKEAREEGRKGALGEFAVLLGEAAADPHCAPEVTQKLHELLTRTTALIQPPDVFFSVYVGEYVYSIYMLCITNS
jgi:hypothetical protein